MHAEVFANDSSLLEHYADQVIEGPYIAEAAALIGDPTRANILAALMGGQALTATELAYRANVAASTASGHLAKLLEGKLIAVTSSGRHRYYCLASEDVANVLEQLMALAGDGPPRFRPTSRCDEAMANARTCYDHLAGRLGVAVADCLVARNHVVLGPDGGFVTERGSAFLQSLSINIDRGRSSKRAFCRACVDWSERRWHIGGYVGAAIAELCFTSGWVERQKDTRALRVTSAGGQSFDEIFGFRV